MTRGVSMTCPDIGYSMPRKKFDSGKIRVLILNVHAACLDPDIPPYFRFSKEYGFVSSNIGTMAQAISHSDIKKAGLITKATTDITVLGQVAFTLCWRHYVHVILCNFRSLFYFIYISLNSWYLNKPDEDWYWPVEISQLNSISRCLISPCRSLLDCNVFNFICFDWSRSFWILRWARLFVHGFFSVFFTLT